MPPHTVPTALCFLKQEPLTNEGHLGFGLKMKIFRALLIPGVLLPPAALKLTQPWGQNNRNASLAWREAHIRVWAGQAWGRGERPLPPSSSCGSRLLLPAFPGRGVHSHSTPLLQPLVRSLGAIRQSRMVSPQTLNHVCKDLSSKSPSQVPPSRTLRCLQGQHSAHPSWGITN